MYVKPLGTITETLLCNSSLHQKFQITKGRYFYFPFNQDVRIYRHDPETNEGEVTTYGEF